MTDTKGTKSVIDGVFGHPTSAYTDGYMAYRRASHKIWRQTKAAKDGYARRTKLRKIRKSVELYYYRIFYM